MKHLRSISGLAMALCAAFAMSSAVAADSYTSPAEAVAGLTGQSVESVRELQEQTGKSYGAIAADAGKLSEFHTAVLQIQSDSLDKMVSDNRLTRTQADTMLTAFLDRQPLCNGSACNGIGCGDNNSVGCYSSHDHYSTNCSRMGYHSTTTTAPRSQRQHHGEYRGNGCHR